MNISPHGYTEWSGLSKLPYQVASVTSEISCTVSPYLALQVMTKFYLRATLYLRPTFTEEVQVAVMLHVSGCARIHSIWQLKTEFHLLSGLYLELTILEGRTTTGSSMTGIVNQALYVTLLASR